MKCRCGFTLLELSLVLVIIGLIVGGVLFGRDMIRGAEILKIHKEYDSLIAAVNTFRAKYSCLPGDCPNATTFFPTTPEGCFYANPTTHNPNPTDYPQENTACNGNGDGKIDVDANTSTGQTATEGFGAWQQLADAQLTSGTYSGSASDTGNPFASASSAPYVADYNCPPALSPSYCFTWLDGDLMKSIGTDLFFYGMVDNAGHLGAILTIYSTDPGFYDTLSPGYQVFTPAEALAYDSKFDDGHPDSGQIFANGDLFAPDCTTPAGHMQGSPYTGPYFYDTLQTDKNCALVFRTGF